MEYNLILCYRNPYDHMDSTSSSSQDYCTFDNLEITHWISRDNLPLMDDMSSVFSDLYGGIQRNLLGEYDNYANENVSTMSTLASKATLLHENDWAKDQACDWGTSSSVGLDKEAVQDHEGKSFKRTYQDGSNDGKSQQQIKKRMKGESKKYSSATHMLASRRRRAKINQKLGILKALIPNGEKVDTNTMLERAISYVKLLQLQIKLLSSDEYCMFAHCTSNGVLEADYWPGQNFDTIHPHLAGENKIKH